MKTSISILCLTIALTLSVDVMAEEAPLRVAKVLLGKSALTLEAKAPAKPMSTLVVKASPDEVIVGVQYHANSLTEFLWGATRPFHLWNESKGKTVILPFWTRPLEAGGLLSWARKDAWNENPGLTFGTLVGGVAIVAAAASSGGGGGDGGGDVSAASPLTVTRASSGSGSKSSSSSGSSGSGGSSGGGGSGGSGGGGGNESPW